MSRLLDGKNAIIYGGGGAIGGGIARTFTREGARVFLAGRTPGPLEAVARDVTATGGLAETAVLDALDERAVDEHVQGVRSTAGSVDVSVNLVSRGDVQGTPLVDMATDDLLHAVVNGLCSSVAPSAQARRRRGDRGVPRVGPGRRRHRDDGERNLRPRAQVTDRHRPGKDATPWT